MNNMHQADNTKVYRKANRAGAISGVVEGGLRELTVTEAVPGLDDEGPYWKVAHSVPSGGTLMSVFYYGYVYNDDVDWSHRVIVEPVDESSSSETP
jgi:hypothetical protein